MLYVVLDGRLANNIFQIAAAYSLTNNITLCLLNSQQESYVQPLLDVLPVSFPIVRILPKGVPLYTEEGFEYKPIPYSANEDLIIKGSFQSYKYLDENKIKSLFRINRRILDKILTIVPDINQEKYYSIHVRRGDYLKYPHKHPFAGKKYYKDAISLLGINNKYVVCSDDIKWCKKTFKGDNFIFIENTTPIIDIYIQSLAYNNIISNSSFSFWGAYLNPNPSKIVIAPKMWFGIGYKHLRTDDLLPQNYCVIENKYSPSRFIYALFLLIKSSLKSIIRKLIL